MKNGAPRTHQGFDTVEKQQGDKRHALKRSVDNRHAMISRRVCVCVCIVQLVSFFSFFFCVCACVKESFALLVFPS